MNNVWRNGERLWDRNSFVQATWQDELFNRWSVRVNAKYANDYTRYINNDDKLIHVENQYLQQEAYFTMAHKVRIFDWWDVSAAYDLNTMLSACMQTPIASPIGSALPLPSISKTTYASKPAY